jgi:hypothetical protein
MGMKLPTTRLHNRTSGEFLIMPYQRKTSGLLRMLIVALVFVGWASHAHAYIGPGLGAGTIAVIVGVVGSILLAVFGIFYYPIKRMIKSRKQEAEADEESGVVEKTEPEEQPGKSP